MRLTFTKIRSIGAHIGFAGAVWIDRPHLEILSCPTYVLPLIRYPHEEPDRSLLVRREESYSCSGGVLPTRYSYSKRSGTNCSVSTHIQFFQNPPPPIHLSTFRLSTITNTNPSSRKADLYLRQMWRPRHLHQICPSVLGECTRKVLYAGLRAHIEGLLENYWRLVRGGHGLRWG